MWDTFNLAFQNHAKRIESQPLDPKLRYLRVSINDQVALLVLGYIDPHPSGPIEVWYTADKEVIRFQNGRLWGTQGLRWDWVDVDLQDAPPLATVPASLDNKRRSSPLRYQRIRTLMPIYEVGLRDTVMIESLAQAPNDAPLLIRDLQKRNPALVSWVGEKTVPKIDRDHPRFQSLQAYYAINSKTGQILYGKQCIVVDYCLSWQVWPTPNLSPNQQ